MCSLCRLPVAKNHNFGQILKFGKLLYQPPFSDEGQIWCSSRLVYFVALWQRETPNFTILLTLPFCGVASWRRSENVEHGCTTTNLPLSNSIKLVSVLQRLHGEIGRTTLTFKSVKDKQTKNSTFLAAPAVDKIRAPPNLTW